MKELIKTLKKNALYSSKKSIFNRISYREYWEEKFESLRKSSAEKITESLRGKDAGLDLRVVDFDKLEHYNQAVRETYEKELRRLADKLKKQMDKMKLKMIDTIEKNNIDEETAEKLVSKKFNLAFETFSQLPENEIEDLELVKHPSLIKVIGSKIMRKGKTSPFEENKKLKLAWTNRFIKRDAVQELIEGYWNENYEEVICEEFDEIDENVGELLGMGEDCLSDIVKELEELREELTKLEEMRHDY